MSPNREHGRLLAARHRPLAEPDTERSLVHYAETPAANGWSLRSALVRLAQPEPTRAARVLEAVRRCDAALHALRRSLEQHMVVADRHMRPDRIESGRVEPYEDSRVVDLARAVAAGADPELLVAGYEEVSPLTDDEKAALPLLGAAIVLERLAEELTSWAPTAPEPPPIDAIDDLITTAWNALDDAGAPREQGQPPRSRPRRR